MKNQANVIFYQNLSFVSIQRTNDIDYRHRSGYGTQNTQPFRCMFIFYSHKYIRLSTKSRINMVGEKKQKTKHNRN